MAKSAKKDKKDFFEKVAILLTKFSGGTTAFIIAISIVIVWCASGPIFNFSETWQLVINTGTTIITFLMVFLIQRAQNKDSLAIQLKLNEIIASTNGASNRLIDVEDMSEKDLKVIKAYYEQLVKLCEKDSDLKQSHSIEEAESRHTKKLPKK